VDGEKLVKQFPRNGRFREAESAWFSLACKEAIADLPRILTRGLEPSDEQIKFTGDDALIQVKSKNGFVQIEGLGSVEFAAGDIQIVAQGENSAVSVISGDGSGQDSLISNGGLVRLTSRDPEGDGGSVFVQADGINIDSQFFMFANTVVDGNGGNIFVSAQSDINVVRHASTSFRAIADGQGTGKSAGSIFINSQGNITFDGTLLTANGDMEANGGIINVTATDDFTHTDHRFEADGDGGGNGGSIALEAGGTLSLNNRPIRARGGDTGDGGSISLKSAADLTVDQAKLLVDPGQEEGSNGNGGSIIVESDQNIDITTDVDASGVGSGNGGLIRLSGATGVSLNDHDLKALGGDNGDGGTVEIITQPTITLTRSNLTNSVLEITSDIDVSAQGDGNGGRITINPDNTGFTLKANVNLRANGAGANGNAGFITITSQGDITLEQGSLIQANGLGSVVENNILLDSSGELESSGIVESNTLNSTIGNGGRIEINSGSLLQLSNISAIGRGADKRGGTLEVNGGEDIIINTPGLNFTGSDEADGGIINSISQGNTQIFGPINADGNGMSKGGSMTIVATIALSFPGASDTLLTANGGTDGGDAGKVDLFSNEDVDLSMGADDMIQARAFTSPGKGGEVIINKVGPESPNGVDVLKFINVESVLPGGGTGGSISVNGVKARNFYTSLGSFPQDFWSSNSESTRTDTRNSSQFSAR